jgi:hypothetical protein
MGGEASDGHDPALAATDGMTDDRASLSGEEGLARRQTYSARFNPGGNDNSYRKDNSTTGMGRRTRTLASAFGLQKARINHNPLPGQ